MGTQSLATVDFEKPLLSGKQFGGQNRIPIQLRWATGSEWLEKDYCLQELFNLKDTGDPLLRHEADTTLEKLLDYVGHSFEEALQKHEDLRRDKDMSLEWKEKYGYEDAFGVDRIRGFWEELDREFKAGNTVKNVTVLVLEYA